MSRGAGSSREQAARKHAQRERARTDPVYSRSVFGAWPPPASSTPVRTGSSATSSAAAAPRRRRRQAGDDEAYRKALGVADGQPLPGKIGQADSAGGARGGRGAAQKGKGSRK